MLTTKNRKDRIMRGRLCCSTRLAARQQGNGGALPAGVTYGVRRSAKGPWCRDSHGGNRNGDRERNARGIYRDAPPPNIYWWTDQGYRYSLAGESGFHRRLEYLETFLLDEKVVSQEVDVSNALDASFITEALRTWKKDQ